MSEDEKPRTRAIRVEEHEGEILITSRSPLPEDTLFLHLRPEMALALLSALDLHFNGAR